MQSLSVRVFLLGSCVALLPALVHAFDLTRHSVRSLGAGGAYTSIVDDESAFFLNIAGLSRHSEHRKIFFSNDFVEGRQDWGLQAAVIDGITEDPLHWGFAFQETHNSLIRRERYAFGTSFNFRDFVLVGINHVLSNYRKSLVPSKGWQFSMDAGLLIFPLEWLSIGASAQNIIRSKQSSDLTPIIYSGGLSANFQSIRLGLDFERDHSHRQILFRGGLEYMVRDYLVLRGGGFRDRLADEKGYTLGAKIQPTQSFGIDMAFFDELKSSRWALSTGIEVHL